MNANVHTGMSEHLKDNLRHINEFCKADFGSFSVNRSTHRLMVDLGSVKNTVTENSERSRCVEVVCFLI